MGMPSYTREASRCRLVSLSVGRGAILSSRERRWHFIVILRYGFRRYILYLIACSFNNFKDTSAPIDLLMLGDGRVCAIKEPRDGHEELEAIPNAFAVEFIDGEDAWSMFCDTAEDKVRFDSHVNIGAMN